MSKIPFQIGDEVEIVTPRVPNREDDLIPLGTIGKIKSLQNDSRLPYYVVYPGCTASVWGHDGWWFGDIHLRLRKKVFHPMPSPEFDLDELELAEKIIGNY